ncbi:hypothetical protein HanIR_Chr17g0874401 [Helianthus annuus]|nr:hypothetical protein HanIR_Chr17g0874401 [Helianthus annuus]
MLPLRAQFQQQWSTPPCNEVVYSEVHALRQLRDKNSKAALANSAEATRLGATCLKRICKWFIQDIRL